MKTGNPFFRGGCVGGFFPLPWENLHRALNHLLTWDSDSNPSYMTLYHSEHKPSPNLYTASHKIVQQNTTSLQAKRRTKCGMPIDHLITFWNDQRDRQQKGLLHMGLCSRNRWDYFCLLREIFTNVPKEKWAEFPGSSNSFELYWSQCGSARIQQCKMWVIVPKNIYKPIHCLKMTWIGKITFTSIIILFL